jgi:membrane protein DedA with SNARE-associated domain
MCLAGVLGMASLNALYRRVPLVKLARRRFDQLLSGPSLSAAGWAGMPALRFGIYTTIGCIPWTAGLAYAGYALGKNWPGLVVSRGQRG